MGLNKKGHNMMRPLEKFQAWTATNVIILISFAFLCQSQTAFKIMDISSPVEALLGQNVTIPCVLTDGKDPKRDLNLNMITDSVRWEKKLNGSNQIIYLLINGNHASHRPNSKVEEKEFKRGIASLTLYDVRRSDEAEYTCHVFVAGNKCTAVRTVEVSAKPVVTLSPDEVTIELDNEKSITCHVDKFYPEFVKIRWEKLSASSKLLALDRETCTSVPIPTSDGTFNVTSVMSVKSSSTQDGDKYVCIVKHRSLNTEQRKSFTVKVNVPTSSHLDWILPTILPIIVAGAGALFLYLRKLKPKISDIYGIDDLVHGKSSNLSWMVSGFKPKNIEIYVYLERGNKRQYIKGWKYPLPKAQNSDTVDHAENGEVLQLLLACNAEQPLIPKRSIFSYSCLRSINITPDKKNDEEAELVIKVKHDAVKPSLTKRQKLKIKGDFFTCHIIDQQYLNHGEEVTLTCDIRKCDPGPLTITWLKGKHIIYKKKKIQDERYSYAETLDDPHEGNVLLSFSSLKFKAKVKEDHDMKYICRVQYSAIEKVLKPFLKTSVIAKPVVEQITSKHVGQQMELSCRIHSFHPQIVKIEWFKEDEELPTTDCDLITGEDGLCSTLSILTYIPEPEDIGKTFRCKVDHQSLPNPETREWKLEEQRPNGIKN